MNELQQLHYDFSGKIYGQVIPKSPDSGEATKQIEEVGRLVSQLIADAVEIGAREAAKRSAR